MMKKENGVTLVALVITIIVLLILATATLAMVMGPSNIFGKANSAAEQTNLANAKDAVRLALLEVVTANYNDNGEQNKAFTLTDATTDTSVVKAVNDQLTSVGDGYSVEKVSGAEATYTGKVQKDGNDVTDNNKKALKATFTKDTTSGSISVSFAMEE